MSEKIVCEMASYLLVISVEWYYGVTKLIAAVLKIV